MKKALEKAYGWVNERVHLEDLVNFMGKKYVPVHRHSIWYYFGGVTLLPGGAVIVAERLAILIS